MASSGFYGVLDYEKEDAIRFESEFYSFGGDLTDPTGLNTLVRNNAGTVVVSGAPNKLATGQYEFTCSGLLSAGRYTVEWKGYISGYTTKYIAKFGIKDTSPQ